MASVMSLYALLLGRTPTLDEAAWWISILEKGYVPGSVAEAIITGPECQQNAIENGVTDEQIIASILGSPEGFIKWSAG